MGCSWPALQKAVMPLQLFLSTSFDFGSFWTHVQLFVSSTKTTIAWSDGRATVVFADETKSWTCVQQAPKVKTTSKKRVAEALQLYKLF